MSEMISVASGFQYSVNISYDLFSDDKLKNFIPTQAFYGLLEDILKSMNDSSTDRARVLVGAYGKGKSHIVLTILSLLMRKDLNQFEKLLPELKNKPELYQMVNNYYDSGKKILPVVITGSNTSISQAFLLALKRTLDENNLNNLMPETNYKAAISVIDRWKQDYKETYNSFVRQLDEPINIFIDKLEDFDSAAYEKFESIYPLLTSGSTFNPFLGFDVVELYDSVIKELKKHGYSGIYVIYDEFSKYLEANITTASVSDTKMLQDFAEKCNRSGKEQMHVMLISHKEISNYIDTLPKQKVDGWRGVSERFKHIHLNSDFSQTYDIIASVIQHNPKQWGNFTHKWDNNFKILMNNYSKHLIFKDLNESQLNQVIYDCYPLHPISTFILPRLSEKVAQNERTLFTFLSAKGISTLPSFLDNYNDVDFTTITPDVIFDYFEPLFKKEVYSSVIHSTYILTSSILLKLQEGSLESKIVKSLCLIYLVEQFDLLTPTYSELTNIYSIDYSHDEIKDAITKLINEEYVIYQKQSNNYLKLKKTSGIDINEAIQKVIDKQSRKTKVKDILNQYNIDKYIYPNRYNDEKEMTRFFEVQFIDDDEIDENIDWNVKSESSKADGIIYAIIPNGNKSIDEIEKLLCKTSLDNNRYLFVTLKSIKDIRNVAIKFSSVKELKDNAHDDEVLYEEYSIIYDDLAEVINNYIRSFTRPEMNEAIYIYNGKKANISRRAALTDNISEICFKVFNKTPIINNEALNKDEVTAITVKSREKIVTALLRSELEYNLGFSGHGQEVSVMRGILLNTGILIQDDESKVTDINSSPKEEIGSVIKEIEEFVNISKKEEVSFGYIYDVLRNPDCGYGLRKGVIPVLLAFVFHKYQSQLIITENFKQIPLNAVTMEKINADPGIYFLDYLDWNEDKESYIEGLASLFENNVNVIEKAINKYDYVAKAIKRWYLNLPKYTKELKQDIDGNQIDKRIIKFNKLLRREYNPSDLLFSEIPALLDESGTYSIKVIDRVAEIKNAEDHAINYLQDRLLSYTKELFASEDNKQLMDQMSMLSVMKDWVDSLDQNINEVIFGNGTEKFIQLILNSQNDEIRFITELARLATGLRIEDWSNSTFAVFKDSLDKYKKTAEEYHQEVNEEEDKTENINGYQISYLDDEGKVITKRFDKVEQSRRGKLLYNAITANVESMGQAISDQEKRQILMTVLEKLL